MMDNVNENASLKRKAYNFIKNKIVTCELLPNAPVAEKELMSEIGASRTPIREALSSLENEGLIRIYPKRGIFVTSITEKDILDIYTVRESIEPTAARLAASYIGEEDLRAYFDIYSPPGYAPTFSEHIDVDRRFHTLIAEASRNEYLSQVLIKMYDHNSRIRYSLFRMRINIDRVAQSREEHLQLIECLQIRDSGGAEKIMRVHIQNGMKAALQILQPSFLQPAV